MEADIAFWHSMTQLLTTNHIMIDRPAGSCHPRYPDMIYPLDYGYLEQTTSSDGGGIDVWLGSLSTVMSKDGSKKLTGILCTFDRLKRDAEIKLLIGCNEDDLQVIRDFHQDMYMLYIPNPMVCHNI